MHLYSLVEKSLLQTNKYAVAKTGLLTIVYNTMIADAYDKALVNALTHFGLTGLVFIGTLDKPKN